MLIKSNDKSPEMLRLILGGENIHCQWLSQKIEPVLG